MTKGIIINNISNIYSVENLENKKIYKCSARGKLKQGEISPVVGDFVLFEITNEEKNEAIIEKIIDRKNYVKRPKLANLSQIIFVLSMKKPKPDLLLLDKQLAFAEFVNVKPIICINKTDLVEEQEILNIEKIYKKIGYTVIKTQATEGVGVSEIKKYLEKNITAFCGNSGVGKSTLINQIFEDIITKEGTISVKNERGKNTTTAINLYKICDDTYIADTPGFSTFEIVEIESKDLYKYFKELKKYSEQCEFVGCGHIKEDNCGIKNAVDKNEIDKGRYERYCKIYEQIKEKEEHKW